MGCSSTGTVAAECCDQRTVEVRGLRNSEKLCSVNRMWVEGEGWKCELSAVGWI